VVFPEVRSPLWDPEVLAILDDLDDRLRGVFVSHAVMGSRHPTVGDALSAARTMGCRSAVVVDLPGSDTLARFVASGLPFTVTRADGDPAAIATAYRETADPYRRAACA
jgi:hypothetical protein